MYLFLLLILECFAASINKLVKSRLSGELKNSKNTIQNIPSFIGEEADLIAKIFFKNTIELVSGKNVVRGKLNGEAKCEGATCKATIKLAAEKLALLALSPVVGPIKFAANHIENRAAQSAAQKAIKSWLYFLPDQIQDSPRLKDNLESMAKDLMRLMCQYKISGNREKIAFANAVQLRLSENPKVNSLMLYASVGIVCLAARMP
jgi:hypothetical protein